MHKMSCQCPKCQTGTGAEFQAFEFEAFDFEMSPQGEFEFEDESEDEALYAYGAVDEYEEEASFGSRDAESPFSDEDEAAAWDSERRRGRAASSARSKPQGSPSRSRSKAGSRPTSPSRSRPPSRNARRLRSRFAAPAAPCVCPVHGTEYVRWIQSTLNRVESANLPVDGVMNAATRKALRRFQSRQGLPVDGIAGPEVEQALRDARRPNDAGVPGDEQRQDQGEVYEFETLDLEAPTRMPTLRRGSRGSAVADLQRRLGAAGFNAGAADGIFGSNTDAAVRAFQRARGLSADGIVGSMTWGALLNAAPGSATPAPGGSPWGAGAGAIRYGKGWGGSEGVADAAKAIAASMGIPVTSEKRNLADTRRVGSSTDSDHYTGNANAFATDLGVSGSRGDELARAIAAKYGIPQSVIGTYTRTTIPVQDRRYSLQLLWKVSGHFDHVHLGIRKV
ncbi:MAG: hypothetical protein CRU78_04060 [Candidatus Accumulibacter phosphatis]|uniref:Peptidoglycan binding-like domain-containing protein n=1 Tax=Candidatus Accumulibacter phosphatis TaxID=327160 RepID=A0A6A7RQC7_9PROT|nr:hypothetical protein [Candidatus Accumulibacter phosphatis]